MLVSIVIPCYNVEGYVSECIESALAQSYSEIEVICVDNGSNDGTIRILKGYEKAGKIQLLEESTKGAPAARNTGWRASQGVWIQFLDADDLISPDKISQQMALIQEVDDAPFLTAATTKRNLTTGAEVRWELLENPWHGLLQNRSGITTANLFNRAYLEEVDGWDESLKSSQEYDLMFRIMKENDRVIQDHDASQSVIQSRSEGSISTADVLGNKHRFLALMAEICAYLKEEKAMVYASLSEEFFQEMFIRIRLNTIDGFPDSVRFHSQVLPEGFQPDKHPYSPAWFRLISKTFGFSFADSIQRLRIKKKPY